jgi:hypothetical protein
MYANSSSPPQVKLKSDQKYQSTFLDFLRGNKQETLSSVKNAPLPKKLVVPYVPPPVRKPTFRASVTNHKFDDDDEDLHKTVASVISKLDRDKLGPDRGRAAFLRGGCG